MNTANKYGLSRHIPAKIKKQIRKRCGFGCVICGLGFYEYEHFDPDFIEAHEHNPDGMTLLCSQCNQKRARKRLSAATVATANANPKCLQKGFTNELFDFGNAPIYVKFAGMLFYDCKYLLVINDIPVLFVSPPKEKDQPVLLSGRFTDNKGKPTLTLIENQWSADTDTWDIECIGPKITIRKDHKDIALELIMDPPRGITISRIDMLYQGIHFMGQNDEINISMDGIHWSTFNGCSASHCHTGIALDSAARAANDGSYQDPA